MYVRFVIPSLDPDSREPQGVLHAAYWLRRSGALEPYEEDWLAEELAWLNRHLAVPPCLGVRGNDRALSWFHPTADRPIRRVRSIAALLVEHGRAVQMLVSRWPGTVIYDDGWQIVAKPIRPKRHRR